jgi:hypothetical protein
METVLAFVETISVVEMQRWFHAPFVMQWTSAPKTIQTSTALSTKRCPKCA